MKRAVAILVSIAILALIWWQVDTRAIFAAARAADPFWLTLGLLAVIPLTLGTALRFMMLGGGAIGLGTATRLILSASTLNLFLPSKMGDLAKAWVLTGRHGFDGRRALALVVLEKMLDMASLLFWGVVALLWMGPRDPVLLLGAAGTLGLLLLLVLLLSPLPATARLTRSLGGVLPGKAGRAVSGFADQWNDIVSWFWQERGRVLSVALVSLALWAAHLAQIWLFARALGYVPLLDNMAFATLAILAGLLPFTMAGIGTRDAAIVYFYRDWLTPGQGAVLGVLATLRYILPAIAGLPFVRDFWERQPAERADA